MKKVLFIACVLCLGLSGLGAATREVKDMAGRRVSIPQTVNKVFTDRFISLMAFALDEDMLCNSTFTVSEAGRKYISPAYYGKPMAETNEEEILKLRPDVILLSFIDESDIEKAGAMQSKLHIPVLLVKFELPLYRDAYSFLGRVLNRPTEAAQIIAFLDKYIIPLNALTKKLPVHPSVYYAEGNNGLNTEAAGTLHSQVIDYLNARNVAQVKTGSIHGMAGVSIEQVLQWQPDAIIAWSGFPGGMGLPATAKKEVTTREYILADAVWQRVSAVSNKKVYQVPALPFGWIDRPPSVNCLFGVLWLAGQLYPEVLTFELNTALKECFRLFYHVEITDDDIDAIVCI